MPVGPDSAGIARLAAASLLRFLEPGRIFLVGADATLRAARRWNLPRLVLTGEDSVVPGVTLERLRQMQAGAGRNPERAGWYLQQFVKMGMARREGVREHYLAWDSDTVLLRPVELFAPDGRVLITSRGIPVLEYYRALAGELLGEPIAAGVSCIREQMMFRRSWMQEILDRIEATGAKGECWAVRIMNQNFSRTGPGQWRDYLREGLFRDYQGIWDFGFSEYELYAAFVRLHHADGIAFREVSAERHGARRFGLKPNRFDLEYLARRFDYASFERWSPREGPRIRRNKWRAFRYALERRVAGMP